MTLREIFNSVIDFDLTSLPETILSLIISLVILVICWVILKNVFEGIFNYFSNNETGSKILKWSVRILIWVICLAFIAMIVFLEIVDK